MKIFTFKNRNEIPVRDYPTIEEADEFIDKYQDQFKNKLHVGLHHFYDEYIVYYDNKE